MLLELPSDIRRAVVEFLEPCEYLKLRKTNKSFRRMLRGTVVVPLQGWIGYLRCYADFVYETGRFIGDEDVVSRAPHLDAAVLLAEERKLFVVMNSLSVNPLGMSSRDVRRLVEFFRIILTVANGDGMIRSPDRIRIRLCEQVIVLGQYILREQIELMDWSLILCACAISDRFEYLEKFYGIGNQNLEMVLMHAVRYQAWDCASRIVKWMNIGRDMDSRCHAALTVLCSFRNGKDFVQVAGWISDLLNRIERMSYMVAFGILTNYFAFVGIQNHEVWKQISTRTLETLFMDISHSPSQQLRVLEFIVDLPESKYRTNASYMMSALDAGKVSIVRMLVEKGAQSVDCVDILDSQPRQKRLKLLAALGRESDD